MKLWTVYSKPIGYTIQTDTQLNTGKTHRYTDTQIHRYTDTQIHRYTDTQTDGGVYKKRR